MRRGTPTSHAAAVLRAVPFAGKGVSEALRRFRDVVAGAPRDLSCGAVLALDASLEPTLTIAPCYTGSDTDAEELRVLRSAPGLVSDGVGRLAFLAQQHVFNPPYGEDRNYWKSQFVSELPDEVIDELLQRMTALGRPPGQVLFESLHGAPKEADENNGAVGFRRAAFNISAMASWQEPALDPQFIAWARDTAAALEPWAVSGGYVNYMQADEPIERVRAAFGDETFERLRTLKRRYDPNMCRAATRTSRRGQIERRLPTYRKLNRSLAEGPRGAARPDGAAGGRVTAKRRAGARARR